MENQGSTDMRAWAKENALEPKGWVENRFRLLEERLARLEENGQAWEDDDAFDESLHSDAFTVGRLRALLAHHDPQTPVTEVEVWASQSLDEKASTPLKAVYRREVTLKLKETKT